MASLSVHAQALKPAGLLACPHPELATVQTDLDSGRFQEALDALLNISVEGETGVSWIRYLTGLALFELERYEQGLDEFNAVVDHTSNLDMTAESRDFHRLAAMCLKKLGWYCRKQERPIEAYEVHRREFEVVERFGSPSEQHDAAISMDVDCWMLKDFEQCMYWEEKSIEAGERITDEHARNRALAVSYNNLAATLADLKRFEEAEPVALKSFEHWQLWEEEEGHHKEFRTVWSYFGIAEVYRQWSENLKRGKAEKKRESALENYNLALDLGLKQELPEDDVKFIQEKIDNLSGKAE